MQFLLNQCHLSFQQYQGVLLTLFVAGLIGGATHCAGMCGPFVIAQTKYNKNHSSILQKLSGASLLPYHFGRMTTYMILGISASLLSKQILGTPLQKAISAIFLSIAGIIFITSALPSSKLLLNNFFQRKTSSFGNLLGKISKPLFTNHSVFKQYALGILLGFIPCGLIFAALMVVSTTGNPFTAGFAMILFTIGTFPSMLLVGIGSQLAHQRWANPIQKIAQGVMIFNGFSLFILAGNIIL